ncbi:hypothetical protein RvY_10951 [Ramazzottius varieornatus]|uniref:Uncharacterized protein n=1 Tax=Ramazzottius varieornatus TaxID=947166 RepID=A0A1D1VEJ0_RAMVA|nr:hypothetical protein RvY_10951 [Ramazzottius varieornatus]
MTHGPITSMKFKKVPSRFNKRFEQPRPAAKTKTEPIFSSARITKTAASNQGAIARIKETLTVLHLS